MRGFVIGMAALTLAACDSGNVPPPGQEPLRPSNPQVAENEVVLRADGLIAGSEAFYFAAGQNEVERSVETALGIDADISENDECGAGPVTFMRFGDGLIVNFQKGSLVGWTLSQGTAGARPDGGLRIGMARDAIEAESGFSPIEGSTLGEEFALGRIGGIIEEDRVSLLYAGTQCFFR